MIDLHFAPTPNGWKISIMLEELGLPYNVIPINIRAGDQWTVSIYDQSIGYAALQGLARLNAAAGRDQEGRQL